VFVYIEPVCYAVGDAGKLMDSRVFPLLVATFVTLFLKVFSLQRKDASKPAGNWFQLLMVLFTKECNALLEVAFTITCEMRKLLWSEDIRLSFFSPTVIFCVPLLCQ